MNILFIHQNFPGQYLHLAQYLYSLGGNQVIGLGEIDNIRRRGAIFGITTVGYTKPTGHNATTHHYLQGTEAEIRRGQTVIRSLFTLKKKGFKPDVIALHPGWGEGLFIRDIFPHTPVLMVAEFFFKANEADIGFDPEFPPSADWLFGIRIRNTTQMLSLPQANVCISPTQWQASRYPWFIKELIHVQHEGIDTSYMRPSEKVKVTVQPLEEKGDSAVIKVNENLIPLRDSARRSEKKPLILSKKDKIVTYMARNLEPYRGFHLFMRALPAIQKRHPTAQFLIIGGTSTSYNAPPVNTKTYKEKYLNELDSQINLETVHFLGRVPYLVLRGLFRISRVHVYLTYPFVLSWSVLEAMSCETLVVASRTAPVEEVIEHEHNGILVDFFDQNALVDAVDLALSKPRQFSKIKKQARKSIVERFELQQCLAKQHELLQNLYDKKYPLRN